MITVRNSFVISKGQQITENIENFISKYGELKSFKIVDNNVARDGVYWADVEITYEPNVMRLEMYFTDFLTAMSNTIKDFDDKLDVKSGETFYDTFGYANDKYFEITVTQTLRRGLKKLEWMKQFTESDIEQFLIKNVFKDGTEVTMYTTSEFILSHVLVYYFEQDNIVFELIEKEKANETSGVSIITKPA